MLGSSGRLVAHALLYVPSPSNIVTLPGYGRQPLWYCKDGCCHGPHMYEEWWIGPESGDITDLSSWRRPYFDTRAFPHDIWAMAQPVEYNKSYVWVDNGRVWGIPQNRLAGITSASNAEFSTAAFDLPSNKQLWLEADVLWGQKPQFGGVDWCRGGCNGVGGSDESHSAYIMAEVLDDATSKPLPGFEKEKCVLFNQTGTLELVWSSATHTRELQRRHQDARVRLRFYFRDATLYAAGFDD